MKKIFTLLSLVMLCVMTASAADNYRRTWDFRNGWSASTLEIMAGDPTHWTVKETGFENTKSFSGSTAVMNYGGEDIPVPELEGLTLGGMKSAAHVQIVSKPGSGDTWPGSMACLWINGKKSADYISFTVPAGENVKIGYCSHKAGEARGFKVSSGFADANGKTEFKTIPNGTIEEVELINSNAEESTLKLSSTNGHHIYYIIIGEGDAPKSANVGYLYYDAAGDGFEALPLYTAISDAENYTFTPLNLNNATPTQEELAAYDAVILDGSIPADEAIVKALQPNIYWQPTVNFNPALAQAFGFGEPLTNEMEIVWVNDVKKSWFTGYEGWALDNMYAISNGVVMPTPLKLSPAHATATSYIVSANEECAFPDSVVAYVYNAGHNAYVYYGLSGDYGAGTEGILKNVVADAVASKADVTACPKPAFKGEYEEMKSTVIISNLNKNAVIHYTTDGTEPTLESPVYTEPLVFTTEATVKAIAVADGYTVSEVNSFDVKLYHQAKEPVVSISGDEATEDATVTIASEEGDEVVLWYNFSGSADTLQSSKYVGPVVIKHAGTLTAFAVGTPESALVQSNLVTADIKANMKKVRRDEVAHFKASGWNTLENLVLDGTPQAAWANSSNYYFTWGKTASKSYENSGEPITDANGDPILDENGDMIFNTVDKPTSVTKNTADPDWQITSRGQVMIYQGNNVGINIGDFGGYNPERAEDYFENLATNAGIQLGSIASGDKATATIQSTKSYAGPFNVVAIVANASGDKTTGVGKPAKIAIQVSTDSINWETIGEEFTTASIYRCYKKFEASYDNEAPAYVRLASVSGSSQNVHDIYIFNHGEKSIAEEEAYTGVEEVNAAAEQGAVKAAKVLKGGRIVIVNGDAEYTTAGARMK